MSVNTYLNDLASNLVLSNDENESIKKSITTLESRLFSWFGSDVIENFKFGSYTRGTILPRKVDSESDIDYMVASYVMADGDMKYGLLKAQYLY